jgi:hypothetical protein
MALLLFSFLSPIDVGPSCSSDSQICASLSTTLMFKDQTRKKYNHLRGKLKLVLFSCIIWLTSDSGSTMEHDSFKPPPAHLKISPTSETQPEQGSSDRDELEDAEYSKYVTPR